MLKVTILAVGKRLSSPFADIGLEYTKRLGQKLQLRWCDSEKELLKAAASYRHAIFLREKGKRHTSKEFAKELEICSDIAFVIGPAEGFSKEPEGTVWSLSDLTFPHQMAIVILLEQVYRAKTLIEGHPYHK